MTTLTVKILRENLSRLTPIHDDKPVVVWLPGSRIDLCGNLFASEKDKAFLIEGNVRPGSACLSKDRDDD